MKPSIRTLIHAFVFFLCCGGVCLAKRGAPSPVAPVRVGDLEYRASVSSRCPGCVEIWDISRHRQVETIVVYRIPYKFWLEQDVQWKFITKLEVHGNDLLVLNEKGDSYRVDLATKRVAKQK